MTAITANGVNGVVIAAQIQEFVQQLSSELTKDERQVQRDARQTELRQGLEAARNMHEKANELEAGAIIDGVMTMASAAGQFGAATQFCTSVSDVPHPGLGKVSTTELEGINAAAGAKVQGFGTLATLGSLVNQGFTAASDRKEALSQEAQVRSKAAGSQADEAVTNLQAIDKLEDSAKDLLQQIAREQHSSVMAILARQ